jgi:hypothetical protein
MSVRGTSGSGSLSLRLLNTIAIVSQAVRNTAKPDEVPLPPADDVQEDGEVAAALVLVHSLPPDVAGEK